MRTRVMELKIKRAEKGFFWWEVSTTCPSAEGEVRGGREEEWTEEKRGGREALPK